MRLAPVAILALALGLLPFAQTGRALTIDNFEEGDFTVTDDTSSPAAAFAEQSGLAHSNVFGGVRLVRVQVTSGLPLDIVTASLTTTPGDDGALLTSTGTGSISFFYDGIAGGDLASGSSGALGLSLSGFDFLSFDAVTTTGGATARLVLWDASINQVGSIFSVATGLNLLPLSEFPALDLSDIRQLELRIQNVTAVDSVLVNHIAAVVPEPGTGLLLGVGLVGVGVRRRIRRRAPLA